MIKTTTGLLWFNHMYLHVIESSIFQYGIKSKEEKEANEKAQREQETAGRVGRQKKTPEEIAAEMNNDNDEGRHKKINKV